MSDQKRIDWKKIKAEYVTGEISLANIAKKYGVSASAVQKKSVKEKWAQEKRKQHKKAADKVAKKLNDKNVRKTVNDIERVCSAASKLIAKINRAIDEVDKREVVTVKTKKTKTNGVNEKGQAQEVEETARETNIAIYNGLVDTKSIAEISKSLLNIKQVLNGTEQNENEKKVGIIELPTMQLLIPPEEELLNEERSDMDTAT